jgi:hypothetical protein
MQKDQGPVDARHGAKAEAILNTLKANFRSLVEKGPLVRHGACRSIWYG